MEEHKVNVGNWTAVSQRGDVLTDHLVRVLVTWRLQSLYGAHWFVRTLLVYMSVITCKTVTDKKTRSKKIYVGTASSNHTNLSRNATAGNL